jgi:nucleotidyltransferase/DNA polymerase involved in DNA repair
MCTVELGEIHGVGHQMLKELREKGYRMCSDLWSVPLSLLQVGLQK